MFVREFARSVRFRIFSYALALLLFLLLQARVGVASPDNGFDLTGPKLEMKVSRSGKSMPIADVPNLRPGDRLWIHVDLPDDQSVHYLLIVAFLRGSTNPPPENWFTRVETWRKDVQTEGSLITVPNDAQQAVLFLAPETGGDFSTLRGAVRGKPGIFVRASQDLNQASLDRTRSDRYLAEIKTISADDPKTLHEKSEALARTLGIKVDSDCFSKPQELQATCLTENTDQMVLDDGHTQSMVTALTSGPDSDLLGAINSTPMMAGMAFSPYMGAVVDLARILGSLHTAAFQYIPALSVPDGMEVNLRLNNPPSFRNPKSVLVVGLPAVEAAQMPPLRAVNAGQVFCLQKSPLVLPAQGAPLVFSTGIAHDFVLHLQAKSGGVADLPAKPDAVQGGFVIDTRGLPSTIADPELTGTLRGSWGFDSYEGPVFHLQSAHAATWKVLPADQNALIVGRKDTLHFQSKDVVCVDHVTVQDQQQKDLKTTWKAAKPDQMEVEIPLQDATAGPLKMTVKQFGMSTPDEVTLQTYAEAAELEHFKLNAGDRQGVLIGKRLDEVNGFELKGARFVPIKLARADKQDELQLAVAGATSSVTFQSDEKLTARVDLKDGRVLSLQTTIDKPRPSVKLISKNVQPGTAHSPVHLLGQDELPQDAKLSFFVKADVPETFSRTEKIEVAGADDAFHVLLSEGDGNLILQDSQTALAVLDPVKNFGPSAFGPLRFRPVDDDGADGDWQTLATLVRIPTLKEIRCPDAPDKQCTLSGSNLFLIDSVASDPQFTKSVSVPLGFANSTLSVPRPNGTLLYIKLRDDPTTVDSLILPVLPDEQ